MSRKVCRSNPNEQVKQCKHQATENKCIGSKFGIAKIVSNVEVSSGYEMQRKIHAREKHE